MGYFEQAQRYEMMSEVAKILQPFYEKARDSKVHVHAVGGTYMYMCMYIQVHVHTVGGRYMYMHVPTANCICRKYVCIAH